MAITPAQRVALAQAALDAANAMPVEGRAKAAAVAKAELALAQAKFEESGATDAAAAANIERLRTEADEAATALQNLTKAKEEAAAAGKGLADELGKMIGIVDKSGSLFGKLSTVITDESGAAFEALEAQALKLTGRFNILSNIVGTVAKESLKLAVAQEKALSSFNRATGAAGRYDSAIRATERANFQYGVTVQESAEAMQNLLLNTSDFVNMSSQQQENLQTTAAIFNELGVGSSTFANAFQSATRQMGMSVPEFEYASRRLFTVAQRIGVQPEQMARNYAALAPEMSKFGAGATDTFIDMQLASKQTGIELNRLIGIANQFDTFDQATQRVGQLNAILGGPFLNTMEMITSTDPIERLRLLQGALVQSGRDFDQMTYYERQAIAAAAGLQDVGELAMVMTGRFDDMTGATQMTAEQMADMKMQAQDNMAAMEQFQQAMTGLAISVTPIVEFVSGLAKGLMSIGTGMQQIAGLTGAATDSLNGFAESAGKTIGLLGPILLLIAGIAAAAGFTFTLSGIGLGLAGLGVAGLVGGFTGFAEGGIVSGPETGYPVMLHGTEAVVPLDKASQFAADVGGGGNLKHTFEIVINGRGAENFVKEVIHRDTSPVA